MSEETDESQKTEEPSQHRLEEAFKKGQIAVSREIVHGFMLMMAASLLAWYFPVMGRSLGSNLVRFISQSYEMTTDNLAIPLQALVKDLFIWLGGGLVALLIAAIAPTLLQTKLNFSAESLKPKFNKISPAKGLERLLGVKAIVEFLKGLTKIGIILALVIWNVGPELMKRIEGLVGASLAAILSLTKDLTAKLLMVVTISIAFIAGLDYLWQKFQHLKSLRMSKQELKDEYKQLDGDPAIKQRQRRIRMERSRQKMMTAVPDATVIITNPTHFAIALKYEMNSMKAPQVVAKGVDFLALKIRELAQEHNIPLVENPPLARVLYQTVEIDQEIPREHYDAVAKIIRYIMGLDKRYIAPKG